MDSKKLSELRRRREEEDLRLTEFKKSIKKEPPKPQDKMNLSREELLESINHAENLILQIDALYRQYMAGAETRPPVELQKQLSDILFVLTKNSRTTTAVRFRFNALQSRFTTYNDRWDRLLKDLETGKKRRPKNK